MTFEQACACVNAIHEADFALSHVERILDNDSEGELGTDEAFRLLRLALSQFMYRLSAQLERRLPLSRDALLDAFGDLGANLDQQRALYADYDLERPFTYPMA